MQVLHRDPVAVAVLSEVVDLSNVWMRNPSGDASFIQEHADEGLVLREMLVYPLDRDPFLKPAGAISAREVHAGHATHANFVDDSVAT